MATIVDERKRGMTLGAIDYLTKPIERDKAGRHHGAIQVVRRTDAGSGRGRRRNAAASAFTRGSSRSTGCLPMPKMDEFALDQLEASPPDVVLLDLMMPEMDGFSACRRNAEEPGMAPHPRHRDHRPRP